MADATTKKLVQVITAAPPELRRAAILVAGEVGTARDSVLVRALLAAVDDPDPATRTAAIEALGKLRAEAALDRLVELVRQGGAEVEAAARAAGHLGARGARAMEKVMAEANPVQRRRIASALALSGTESAAVAAAHALLDEDPRVVDAAARALASELPQLNTSQRRALADHLLSSLQQRRKTPLSAASEAAMLRVLAALHDPRTELVFWSRLDATYPAPVRATALQALGALPELRHTAQLPRLFQGAADPDFQVAAPALFLLKKLPVNRKNLKEWLKLLEAPDGAVRRCAVEKLQDQKDAAVAQALAAQLTHPDRALRREAFAALARSETGRQVLVETLLATKTADEAWSLARELAAWKPLASRQQARLFTQACRYLEAGDRRAEPLLFLLQQTDPEGTRAQVKERALALRKKRNYAGALAYLKLLARDPACGAATRFELAATGLKLSSHDLAAEARSADPALAQFVRLLQDPTFDLIGQVKKAKWLDEEDLFYLGFHFAEQNRRDEKEFGRQILELLIQRAPRSQRAKDARRKLKSEGLG